MSFFRKSKLTIIDIFIRNRERDSETKHNTISIPTCSEKFPQRMVGAEDSNPWPSRCKRDALTNWARRLKTSRHYSKFLIKLTRKKYFFLRPTWRISEIRKEYFLKFMITCIINDSMGTKSEHSIEKEKICSTKQQMKVKSPSLAMREPAWAVLHVLFRVWSSLKKNETVLNISTPMKMLGSYTCIASVDAEKSKWSTKLHFRNWSHQLKKLIKRKEMWVFLPF